MKDKIELTDLGFVKVDRDKKICFYDCIQQPLDYYGMIIFDTEKKLIEKIIKEEYYDKDLLEKAIENERIKYFK